MKNNNFLQEKNDLIKPARLGEIVEGTVVGIDRSSIYIDLSPIGTGLIFGKEFQEAKDFLKNLKISEKISAKIISLENDQGYLELSAAEAAKEISWDKLREIKEKGETVKVKIIGANKGGLLTEIYGSPAFLPVSQLSFQHYPRVEGTDKSQIIKELQKFIGKDMEVKIINLDLAEGKLILSEKASDLEIIKEILKDYKVGDVVEGEITKITDFGAFIRFPIIEENDKQLRYLEGLIHISEIDWQMVNDPGEIIKVGQKVKAKITEIVDNRIFLSLKALKKDPWQDIEKKYKKGDSIKGDVVRLNNFGAFIQLEEPKIQALCHISEFGTKTKMEERIKKGEKYTFKILSINPKEHRMTLSLAK